MYSRNSCLVDQSADGDTKRCANKDMLHFKIDVLE